MSTIIAGINRGRGICFIGGDSLCSNGDMKTIRKNPKVFDTHHYMAGAVGSFRFIQLVELLKVPQFAESSKRKKFPYHWIVEIMIPNYLIPKLKAWNYEMKSGDKILLIVSEEIFVIESDFQVGHIKGNYFAIGSGAPYALGSLHSAQSNELKIDAYTKAFDAACYYDKSTGGDFITIGDYKTMK